ncbi:hypothetical protein F4860DRAFT_523336 [Xylaria cubensis]|nr:hypothetical protein F4860DRAFT_523336 [Xylaria cubensis]
MALSVAQKHLLAKLDDFTDWNKAFKSKAHDLDLWEYLQPTGSCKEWPKAPRMLEYSDYPKQPKATSASTASTLRQTRQGFIIMVLEEEFSTLQSILEMSKEGKEAYQFDWSRYTTLKRDYDAHRKRLAELSTWMSDTVSQDY